MCANVLYGAHAVKDVGVQGLNTLLIEIQHVGISGCIAVIVSALQSFRFTLSEQDIKAYRHQRVSLRVPPSMAALSPYEKELGCQLLVHVPA